MVVQGDIILAWVTPPRGQRKVRPVCVITRTDEIDTSSSFVAVAITTTYPDPPPHQYVELPWHAQGNVITALRRRSAAVCDWLIELREPDVIEVKGQAPLHVLECIIERVRECGK